MTGVTSVTTLRASAHARGHSESLQLNRSDVLCTRSGVILNPTTVTVSSWRRSCSRFLGIVVDLHDLIWANSQFSVFSDSAMSGDSHVRAPPLEDMPVLEPVNDVVADAHREMSPLPILDRLEQELANTEHGDATLDDGFAISCGQMVRHVRSPVHLPEEPPIELVNVEIVTGGDSEDFGQQTEFDTAAHAPVKSPQQSRGGGGQTCS